MEKFDTLRCRYPLPDKSAQGALFKTQSLACLNEQYIISEEGRLFTVSEKHDPALVTFNGLLHFFTTLSSLEDDSPQLYTYAARFANGKLQDIRRIKDSESL